MISQEKEERGSRFEATKCDDARFTPRRLWERMAVLFAMFFDSRDFYSKTACKKVQSETEAADLRFDDHVHWCGLVGEWSNSHENLRPNSSNQSFATNFVMPPRKFLVSAIWWLFFLEVIQRRGRTWPLIKNLNNGWRASICDVMERKDKRMVQWKFTIYFAANFAQLFT